MGSIIFTCSLVDLEFYETSILTYLPPFLNINIVFVKLSSYIQMEFNNKQSNYHTNQHQKYNLHFQAWGEATLWSLW